MSYPTHQIAAVVRLARVVAVVAGVLDIEHRRGVENLRVVRVPGHLGSGLQRGRLRRHVGRRAGAFDGVAVVLDEAGELIGLAEAYRRLGDESRRLLDARGRSHAGALAGRRESGRRGLRAVVLERGEEPHLVANDRAAHLHGRIGHVLDLVGRQRRVFGQHFLRQVVANHALALIQRLEQTGELVAPRSNQAVRGHAR